PKFWILVTKLSQFLIGYANGLNHNVIAQCRRTIIIKILGTQIDDLILHLEFQTQPNQTMPFRMLDYRIRLHRRYPHHEVEQLVLEQTLIQNIFTKELMQDSVIYQDILAEGREKGERRLILKLLTRRFDTLSPDMASQINALSLEQLERLGEALLDFVSIDDLEQWLQKPQLQ
ncbi:MAG: DUF4351 domain-containing protein, partial [Acaryochloridaceae cyanobacterium RL_2_7]|nr:DUF4351 domain-containing protein [Acaryochloridaceae cyanobacterium RL_2_7]